MVFKKLVVNFTIIAIIITIILIIIIAIKIIMSPQDNIALVIIFGAVILLSIIYSQES